MENVLAAEIRPPRARAELRRDLGTTLYRSSGFFWAVLLPPLAFAVTGAGAAASAARLGQDTEGSRRRQARRQVRRHLRAAEGQLDGGQRRAFYIEIDRVLSGALSARLGQPVAGLSRVELARRSWGAAGCPGPVADQALAALEECDRARFAPGSAGAGERRAALERAGELLSADREGAARAAGGDESRHERPAWRRSARCWRCCCCWRCWRGRRRRAPMPSTRPGSGATTPTFRGDYDTALAAYVELDRQGIVSADLFYNLGVAYYRKGDLGRAIWSFERAVALDPEAEDARFNLAQARKLADPARGRQAGGGRARSAVDPGGHGADHVHPDLGVPGAVPGLLRAAVPAPAGSRGSPGAAGGGGGAAGGGGGGDRA